jgi:hypothetical protein
MRLSIGSGAAMGGALAVAVLPAGAATSPAALDRPVCGPAAVETVAQNREARVYVRSLGGRERVFGCHQERRRARLLGDRSRLRLVRLAGRYTAVVRTARAPVGEQLVVFNLRRGRARRRVEARRDPRDGVFVRVRLDRTGIAAYTLRRPPRDGLPGTVAVAATADGFWASAPDIDPSVLGLAGISVAFLQGETFRLAPFDEAKVTDGTLLRVGDVRFTVRRGRLWLHAPPGAERRRLPLGYPMSACLSSSGCEGIDALQVTDRFVAIRDRFYATGESGGQIRVYDVARGRRRTTCRSRGLHGDVGSFVLTDTGLVACALEGVSADATEDQIRAEGVVLDQGPGIDVDSRMRRGDRLFWFHDGLEQSAPLPTRRRSPAMAGARDPRAQNIR